MVEAADVGAVVATVEAPDEDDDVAAGGGVAFEPSGRVLNQSTRPITTTMVPMATVRRRRTTACDATTFGSGPATGSRAREGW
jgi:hypothetical protein